MISFSLLSVAASSGFVRDDHRLHVSLVENGLWEKARMWLL